MTVEQLLVFNLALFVAMASPGPALLIAIQTTLSSGRRGGIAIGCGLAIMASTWTLMALLGLEVVFTVFPWTYAIVKTVGATYLLYIAWSMWRRARDKLEAKNKATGNLFREGLLINLLNPKSVLFAAAVLVVIFPASMSLLDSVVVVVNHFILECIFYTMLALVMSTTTISSGYLKMKVCIDRSASVVLGSLGVRLFIDR